MIKPKTYFKQVPPKIVREIVEQQTEQEKVAVLPATTRNRKPRVNLVEGLGVIRYEWREIQDPAV